MSYNRGVKRNSSGNRSFSRNSGGGNSGYSGIGMGGGSSGSHGMNPWESGVMPGRGILPTPSNNLSLNSPQAQLVIASNLLSNLLRSQQDTQPQVPSLLSLGTSLNGPGSNFRSSQSYSSNRYSDRQGRGNLKSQRSQPYSKMGNRARDGIAGRRGPSSAQQSRAQSGNQRNNGNQHRNDKSKSNSDSKKNQTGKKEQQDLKTSDNEKADTQPIAKSDENKKTEDIKIEQNDEEKEKGEVTPTEATENDDKPMNDSTKEAEETNKTNSSPKKTEESAPAGKKSETRHAESRYAAVPINQMFCHVCNKHMWDGFSFENHLRGRAHQLMMDKLDESYKLRVDFMRHELKVAEEQRELSLHNSKRRGKKVSVDLSVREYCTMCDLHFYGTLSTHRKSEKHQQLKIFLHPRCTSCAKEFPSRIEYDEHCLTPGHMVNSVQIEEQKKTKKNKLAKGESEVRTAEDEDKDSGSDPKSNENDDELPENTEYITDIKEDVDLTKYKVPSYKYCRQNQLKIGASLVKEVQGYHCDKCRRFMLTEEDMNSHLRTVTHYRNFVSELKALTTPITAESNNEKPTDESITQENEPKVNDEVEIESKRRKLDDSMTVESEDIIKDDPLNDTEDTSEISSTQEKEKQKEDGNDKYDPMEASIESEEENIESKTDKKDEKENDKNDKEDGKNDKNEKETVKNDVNEKETIKKDKNEKEATANTENDNEKSIEAWEDGDNEAEFGFGNLLGDDNEDQEPENLPVVQQKQPQQKTQTPQPSPQNQSSQPTVSVDVTSVKLNNSQDKGTPRGRGYRGRGHQRARRSRR
ncbi:zinc finger protein on ecdysone puffs [Microplitis demolitor]|uniref:zinc finger protein on ecdysone puffs n=1 Tax=Microplitis demolitor TaxID=69319 RepID=UPI0004CC9A4C|nr:zinc finger protein on ecdysone puffs [Microplitis demolitor]